MATVESISNDGTINYSRTVVRTCGNRKVGAHTVTTSRDRSTCPRDCDAWIECYGTNVTQSGGTLFDNVTNAPVHALSLNDLPATIDRRATRAVRYSVVGDVLTNEGTTIDRDYIAAMNDGADVARRNNRPVWSYTHAWIPADGREHVEPDDFNFNVRASCASVERVHEAHARGWYTALIVNDRDDALIGSMIDGRRVTLCPAQRDDNITCETCCGGRALCSLNTAVVAFAAHGTASDKVRNQNSKHGRKNS